MSFIKDYKARQWLYGVAAAVMVLLGGYGIFSAEEQQNILSLITAVLNLGGAAAFGLAANKSQPANTDTTEHRGKYGDYSDET